MKIYAVTVLAGIVATCVSIPACAQTQQTKATFVRLGPGVPGFVVGK